MLQYESYTNIGSRDINEDCFGIAQNGESYCFVVADGLGGHAGGEIASKCAVDTVCNLFEKNGFSGSFFENSFNQAQKAILEKQEMLKLREQLKTTLIVLVVHNSNIYWAHVGDSRAYWFKSKRIKKRTLDHSVPQMLAISGVIRDKDIRNHVDRNKLLRVLGVKGETPRYECGQPINCTGFNAFLLCTDGYWELIEEETMEKLLKQSSNPSQWIKSMNESVREKGGKAEMDNYTAIGIFCGTKRFWEK